MEVEKEKWDGKERRSEGGKRIWKGRGREGSKE